MISSIGRYEAGVGKLFTGTIEDDASPAVGIDKSRINSMTLSVRDTADDHYFIGAAGAPVDVKGTNSVGFTLNNTGGGISWSVANSVVATRNILTPQEERIARLDWVYDTTKTGFHEHRMRIVNFLPLCVFDDVLMYREGLTDTNRLLVESMIDAVSSRVESAYGRKLRRAVGVVQVVRVFDDNTYSIPLDRVPIESVASVKEGGETPDWNATTALDPTDYTTNKARDRLVMRLRPFLKGEVQVTFTGGYARDAGAVPFHVRQAIAQQVAFMHQNKDRIGQTSQSVQGGSVSIMRIEKDLLPSVKAVLDEELTRVHF